MAPSREKITQGSIARPTKSVIRNDPAGIRLQILGIGRNGHIGFNEPTSSLGSLNPF